MSVTENANSKRLVPNDTRIVYISNTTTKSNLRNKIMKGLKRDSGIYSVPCKDCNKKYIGESDYFKKRRVRQQHKII